MSIFYQAQLKSQLERSEYLILSILVNLLQCIKEVSLEALATAKRERERERERGRSRDEFFMEIDELRSGERPIHWASSALVIVINLVLVLTLSLSLSLSLFAIPIYFGLLPKLGSSNFSEQQAALS